MQRGVEASDACLTKTDENKFLRTCSPAHKSTTTSQCPDITSCSLSLCPGQRRRYPETTNKVIPSIRRTPGVSADCSRSAANAPRPEVQHGVRSVSRQRTSPIYYLLSSSDSLSAQLPSTVGDAVGDPVGAPVGAPVGDPLGMAVNSYPESVQGHVGAGTPSARESEGEGVRGVAAETVGAGVAVLVKGSFSAVGGTVEFSDSNEFVGKRGLSHTYCLFTWARKRSATRKRKGTLHAQGAF